METKIERIIMLDTRVVAWTLATFSAVTFVVCVAYGLVAPDSYRMSGFLEGVLPGFEWLTLPGFLLGLVEAFAYGAYAGLVFSPLYNGFQRAWGSR